MDKFYSLCDPDRENLCLYGKFAERAWPRPLLVRHAAPLLSLTSCPLSSHTRGGVPSRPNHKKPTRTAPTGEADGFWKVDLPEEEVPPELPEPVLGINFARDGMQRKDWIALIAVHSDAWLIAVAYYYGAKVRHAHSIAPSVTRCDRAPLFLCVPLCG